jgi:hypothetical protein
MALSSSSLAPDFSLERGSLKSSARTESSLLQYTVVLLMFRSRRSTSSRLDQRFMIRHQHHMCAKPRSCCTCGTRRALKTILRSATSTDTSYMFQQNVNRVRSTRGHHRNHLCYNITLRYIWAITVC